MTVARAARYQRLVEEAAEQLKCPPDSELAQHVGTLRLARETFAERLISGREVNPADLVRLDDCLRQYLPARPEPPPQPLNELVRERKERQDRLCPESIEPGRLLDLSPVSGRGNANGDGSGG